MPKKNKNVSRLISKILKCLVAGILILFLVFVAVTKLLDRARTMEVFKVRAVELDPSVSFISPGIIDSLSGKSIFDVDLMVLRRRIKARYPQLSHLRVIRKFPNRIYVSARKRSAFAQVVHHRDSFIVDRDGVILSEADQPDPGIPQIMGIRENPESVPIGSHLKSETLSVALSILISFTDTPGLSRIKTSFIEVGNLSRINLYDESNLRIILEKEDLHMQIKKLEQVLSRDNIKLEEFKYIDLRFKDPVLGKR